MFLAPIPKAFIFARKKENITKLISYSLMITIFLNDT
jgi:hypothetical protein